ncbi:VOC family protein [Nocardia puris]|nr:VOC family protein [Nocardia puris]MBF6366092.1 VOC family protein [Nocardia puris]MBF6458567.1 VOC family protein [Nocardia puris]
MAIQVSVIMLGVADVDRARKFYSALGAEVTQGFPGFVRCKLGTGSELALTEWEAAAEDAGVPGEGAGFRGVSLHYLTETTEEVDEVMGKAIAAGGSEVRAAVAQDWGYSGYFSDPDGYLWKVATG